MQRIRIMIVVCTTLLPMISWAVAEPEKASAGRRELEIQLVVSGGVVAPGAKVLLSARLINHAERTTTVETQFTSGLPFSQYRLDVRRQWSDAESDGSSARKGSQLEPVRVPPWGRRDLATLAAGQSITMDIVASEVADFSRPGTYRVRLVREAGFIDETEGVEIPCEAEFRDWSCAKYDPKNRTTSKVVRWGRSASNVVTIVVTP